MAGFLQELVDAPATEPVARVTGYYAGHLSIATVDGRVLPAGTALYTAPPHQSEHHLEMVNTPAPSVPDAELVTVPRELLGAASYAIKKNLPAPKILEQLRRYALGGVAAPTPAPSVPDVANTFKRRAEEIVAMAVNRENYAKINRTIADLVTDIANAAEAPTPAEVLTTTNQAQTSSSQVEAPESEPFGYFKAEPFGWTDCAETDDGAIALYTAPPAPSVSDGWKHDCAGILQNDVELWVDSCPHCGKPRPAAPAPAEAPVDLARDAEPWKLLLENLVEGLNKTYWSSWQGTAHFDEYLREAISAIERDKLKGQS
jgi:hypothetical protein